MEDRDQQHTTLRVVEEPGELNSHRSDEDRVSEEGGYKANLLGHGMLNDPFNEEQRRVPDGMERADDEARDQGVVSALQSRHSESSPAEFFAQASESDEEKERRDHTVHGGNICPVNGLLAEKGSQIQRAYSGDNGEEQGKEPPPQANLPDEY